MRRINLAEDSGWKNEKTINRIKYKWGWSKYVSTIKSTLNVSHGLFYIKTLRL